MNQSSEIHSRGDDRWDELAEYLEAFLHQWEELGFGPCLSDHLPPADDPLRRDVLIECIKVDLEYRHESGGPILRLEDYLAEHPELGTSDGMPLELIREECHLRKQSTGQEVAVDELLDRFPDKADDIRRHFSVDDVDNQSKSGRQLNDAYQPGDRLGDFYLMTALGTGAFGSVYLARQESMQRLVALKVSGDKGTEAQTLAQLDHPNIVRVYDQVRLPEQDLRLLYMQFVAGGTLRAVVKASQAAETKSGQIISKCVAEALEHTGVASSQHVSLKNGLAEKSWAEVTCHLGMEVAQALHYAHEQGILHRDVKPANVLIEANGSARLADFNISFGTAIEGDNAEASFGGSLAYMSPEQLAACDPSTGARPTDLDARSDVFSLGVLLWELMYGKRPFPDESVVGGWLETLDGLIALRKQGPCEPLQSSSNAPDALLLSILRRCMAPDPADRFQTAGELARELGLCLQPRVARLIRQRDTGWRRIALAWPMIAFLCAAIGPHIFAAGFNYAYNETKIVQAILENHQDVEVGKRQRAAFETLVIVINAIAFSAAFAICIGYNLPVVRAIRRERDGPTEPHTFARLRSLKLSRFVTILGITEWIIAGIAYPTSLFAITGHLTEVVPIYFFSSLLICGLLAAAYPFFLTATLTIQAFVPTLLRRDRLTSSDVTEMRTLSNQAGWSLYLAGGVPAAGMMILLITREGDDDFGRTALSVLSVLGAIGFAFVLGLSRSLQSDIEALIDAYRLARESNQE